jgi:hypothetical protein
MKILFKTIQFISILVVGFTLTLTFCRKQEKDNNDNKVNIRRLFILNQYSKSSNSSTNSSSGTTITIPQGLGQ